MDCPKLKKNSDGDHKQRNSGSKGKSKEAGNVAVNSDADADSDSVWCAIDSRISDSKSDCSTNSTSGVTSSLGDLDGFMPNLQPASDSNKEIEWVSMEDSNDNLELEGEHDQVHVSVKDMATAVMPRTDQTDTVHSEL